MGKHTYFDSDTEIDELADVDVKSPKKAKKQTKKDAKSVVGEDSPNKRKRAAGTGVRNAWTKEEEEDFLDCLQDVIAAGMSSALHNYPRLAARSSGSCLKHWYSWRRRQEISMLGAPTIDKNGKKLPNFVLPDKKDE